MGDTARSGRPGVGAYVALLRRPAFGRFWLAQLVSQVGTGAFRVALAWYVVETLGNAPALGATLLAFTAPQVVAGLGGGVLADRFDRKVIVVLSDLASGLLFLGAWFLAVGGQLGLGPLIGVAFLAGISTAVLEPTIGALLPALVERDELQEANALRTLGSQGASVIGPSFAGLAISVLGVEAFFLVDAVSFFVALVVFAPAKVPASAPPARDVPTSTLRDLGNGIALVMRTSWIRTGIVAGGLANLLLVAPLAVLVPALIEERSLGPGTWGAFGSALAVGFVLGATVVVNLGRDAHPRMVRGYGGLVLGGLVCFLFLLPTTGVTVVLVGGVLGAGFSLFDVLWDSHVQTHVDNAYLARVLGTDTWTSFGLRSLGLLLAPMVGVWLGFVPAIVAGAAIFLALVALLLARTSQATEAGARTDAPSASC